MYYHAEYMKNNTGKIIETKIVSNEKSVIYDNDLNLVFTRINGIYSGMQFVIYLK